MNARTRLPDRRRAVREIVLCKDSQGSVRAYEAGFGLDDANAVREVFCIPQHARTGTDLKGLLDDACIAISRALQRGDRVAEMAKSLGELRPEGETSGPPASPLGAILRAGVKVEEDIAAGRLKVDAVIGERAV